MGVTELALALLVGSNIGFIAGFGIGRASAAEKASDEDDDDGDGEDEPRDVRMEVA